jgi:hypothetical protein
LIDREGANHSPNLAGRFLCEPDNRTALNQRDHNAKVFATQASECCCERNWAAKHQMIGSPPG